VRIADLPENERPRERLWHRGVAALSDRELVALVLRGGRSGESALDLAAALLSEYGGVHGLAAAGPEELAARCGIGRAKAAALVASFRLGHLAADPVPSGPLKSAQDVAAVARHVLAHERRERVVVLVCDAGNRVRRVVPIAEGSVDRSLLPVREVLNAVLRHDGRAFALAHNHPSGNPEPSEQDRRVTEEIAAAAKLVGLRFLDHVVVADGGWRSALKARR
jgi:DNA repair protein RadC